MKNPLYTLTVIEPVACAKEGKSGLMKLLTVLLAILAAVVIPVVVWAYITDHNLNRLPLIPRIVTAAAAAAMGIGITRLVRERNEKTEIDFYKDSLVVRRPARSSLWYEGTRSREVTVEYRDIKRVQISENRANLSLSCGKWKDCRENKPPRAGGGTLEVSLLNAQREDIKGPFEKYARLEVHIK